MSSFILLQEQKFFFQCLSKAEHLVRYVKFLSVPRQDIIDAAPISFAAR